MAKVTITPKHDMHGILFYCIEKKKSGITRAEAYEAMEREGLFGHWLIDFNVPEETPTEIYDGVNWLDVYKPEDMFQKLQDLIEQAFNDGYDAAIKDMEGQNGRAD